MYRSRPAEIVRFAVGLPLTFIYFAIMVATVLIYTIAPRRLFAALQNGDRRQELTARISDLRGFLKEGDLILDVGAGRGDFLKATASELRTRGAGIDIIDYSDEDVTVSMFDGRTIPMPAKSVDMCVAAFVLHHTREQENLLEEMRRVSRKYVVIYEDAFFTPWQWVFTVVNDYYSNIVVGSIKAWKNQGRLSITSMPMPLTFRSVRGWQRLFQEMNFRESKVVVRHSAFKPMSKVTFVLEFQEPSIPTDISARPSQDVKAQQAEPA